MKNKRGWNLKALKYTDRELILMKLTHKRAIKYHFKKIDAIQKIQTKRFIEERTNGTENKD